MAREDPVAYKSYVQQQLQEGADFFKGQQRFEPPKAHFCCKFRRVDDQMPVFLNFCSFLHMDPYKEELKEVPLYISQQLRNQVDVIVHPGVIERCSADATFKSDVITLVRDTLRAERSVFLDPRSYTPEPIRPLMSSREAEQCVPHNEDVLRDLMNVRRGLTPVSRAAGTWNDEAHAEVGALAVEPPGQSQGFGLPPPAEILPEDPVDAEASIDRRSARKVVELPVVVVVKNLVVNDAPSGGGGGGGVVAVTCTMPCGVTSASDCRLEVDATNIMLSCAPIGLEDFRIPLPQGADPSVPFKCRFVKTTRTLKIEFPLKKG